MEENVFYSYVCHFCKKPSIDLKKCTSCKIVAYCSKLHQEKDWKTHRKLCQVINRSNKIVPKRNINSYADWEKYMSEKRTIWQALLKRRRLRDDEHQFWMFSRYCAICYSEENLSPCDNCLNVSYCSEEHKATHYDAHSKFCAKLRVCMMIDCYLFRIQLNYINCLPNPKIKLCGDMSSFPLNLIGLCNILLEDKVELNNPINDELYVQDILVCDQFAGMATILSTLENLGLIIDRELINSNVLTLHLVGASKMELCINWTVAFELAFHWIRNLVEIEVYLIGPDIQDMFCDPEVISFQFCTDCKTNDKLAFLNTINSVYHDVIDIIPKPDIIVMFNCGLHEYQHIPKKDLWKGSLESLFFHGVPLILTAYTEKEIEFDISRLKSIKPNLQVKMLQKNPFANMRPYRQTSETTPIFHLNEYVATIL